MCAVPVPFAEVSNRSYFLCGSGVEKNNLLLLVLFTKLLNQLKLSALFKSCDSVDMSGTEIKTQTRLRSFNSASLFAVTSSIRDRLKANIREEPVDTFSRAVQHIHYTALHSVEVCSGQALVVSVLSVFRRICLDPVFIHPHNC